MTTNYSLRVIIIGLIRLLKGPGFNCYFNYYKLGLFNTSTNFVIKLLYKFVKALAKLASISCLLFSISVSTSCIIKCIYISLCSYYSLRSYLEPSDSGFFFSFYASYALLASYCICNKLSSLIFSSKIRDISNYQST